MEYSKSVVPPWEYRSKQKMREIKMVKKLVVLTVFFMALCFAGVGCFRGAYYDGPYRIGGGSYYYYNGGFYVYDGGAFRFHHEVPRGEREYYEEHYSKNREHYNRDYDSWREQHPDHAWTNPR
jgi:hypothetical protein